MVVNKLMYFMSHQTTSEKVKIFGHHFHMIYFTYIFMVVFSFYTLMYSYINKFLFRVLDLCIREENLTPQEMVLG